jgi:adenosine kinase
MGAKFIGALFMDIIFTGSVAYDYLMTFQGKFSDNILPEEISALSLSFLVDSLVVHRGGVAPNIAYTMAMLGGAPKVMATVGEDFDSYRTILDASGVDTNLMKVIPSLRTASFFATTDHANSQLASFYPGAMNEAASQSLKDIKNKPELVVISPNSPDAMQKFVAECGELGIRYLFDPGQQIARMSGEDLKPGVLGAWALFVNEYEFALIQKKTGLSKEEILNTVELVVVTLGEKGVDVYVDGGVIHTSACDAVEIKDPTGAGDAFRGGFLMGLSLGFDWDLCSKMGSLTAVYVLEAIGPQEHRFTPEEFVARFEKCFGSDQRLNVLVH